VVGFESEGPAVDAGTTFGAPTLVTGLLDPADEIQDASLSPDELEIYFASLKDGTYDIWMSTRSAIGAPWNPGSLVQELSTTTSSDFEPDLSYDGLTIYFSSDRPGAAPTLRIWVARRQQRSDPWGVPQIVDLGTTQSDRAPAVDVRGLLMALASDRGTGDLDIYFSSRDTPTAAWGLPADVREVNSSVFDWDPALYNSGLALVFGSRRSGDQATSDLFETTRATYDTPISTPRSLVEHNSPMSEGDPWLSNDGRHIVFSSDRSGISQLYEAWR
jgi:Tol biopolymer transport system component